MLHQILTEIKSFATWCNTIKHVCGTSNSCNTWTQQSSMTLLQRLIRAYNIASCRSWLSIPILERKTSNSIKADPGTILMPPWTKYQISSLYVCMVNINQSIILWKHYLNLLSQSLGSVSSDLALLLALMKIRYRKLCDNKFAWCFHNIILRKYQILQSTVCLVSVVLRFLAYVHSCLLC